MTLEDHRKGSRLLVKAALANEKLPCEREPTLAPRVTESVRHRQFTGKSFIFDPQGFLDL